MKKIKLTKGELNHILSLLLGNQEDGCYTSPKDQYWKRHYRILDKLSSK